MIDACDQRIDQIGGVIRAHRVNFIDQHGQGNRMTAVKLGVGVGRKLRQHIHLLVGELLLPGCGIAGDFHHLDRPTVLSGDRLDLVADRGALRYHHQDPDLRPGAGVTDAKEEQNQERAEDEGQHQPRLAQHLPDFLTGKRDQA